MGGRLTLIRSVFASILIYQMSVVLYKRSEMEVVCAI